MLKRKNTFFLLPLVFLFAFGQEIVLAENNENDKKNIFFPRKETSAYANFCVGFYLMLDQRWEEAVGFLNKALQTTKHPEKIHNSLATCYFQLGKKEEAMSHIEKVAQLKPEDFGIHYTLGNMYESEGKKEKAILEYESANNCNIEDINKVFVADMLFRLSNLYFKNNDLEKVLNTYKRILDYELTDEPAKVHYRLGVINFEMKRTQEAIKELTEARKYDSNLESVSFYLASCYEELEDYDNAIVELNSFVAKQSDAWPVRISLSNLYETVQKYEEAESEREKILELLRKNVNEGSEDIREHIVLSRLLQRKGKSFQAVETLENAILNIIDYDKEDVEILKEIHLLTANMYYEINEYNSVVKELRKVLEIVPDCHEASNFLGYFFIERGERLREALSLIENALKSEPENGAYLDSLGWAYYKLATENDGEKIMLALRKLVEASKYAKDPEIIEHIGDVNYSLGLWGEAQKQWENALKQWEDATKELPPHLIYRSERELRTIRTVKTKLEKLKDLKIKEDSEEKAKRDKRVVSKSI